MTYPELQIQLDLNSDNRIDVLKNVNTCCQISIGYLFVDQEDGQCYLFDKYGNLDDIDKVKSIEYRAFDNCTSLKTIKIPNSVKSIEYCAFEGCKSLTKIKIPNSIESLRYWAFYGCSSLVSIKIPSSVEYIGDWAFASCPSLKEVVFKGKTMNQVKEMNWCPWGIQDISIIKTES